jgi:hypothetical protein
VTFNQILTASSTFYPGTIALDSNFDKTTTTNNLYADDIYYFAVVHLTQDPGITPAQLPAAGQDATLSTGQPLTVVGYGTSATQGGGPPTYPPTGQREAADLALQAVTPPRCSRWRCPRAPAPTRPRSMPVIPLLAHP